MISRRSKFKNLNYRQLSWNSHLVNFILLDMCCLFDWSFERKTYTWSSRKSSRSWNPADFGWNLVDFVRISGEIWRILYGFQVKSGRFCMDFEKSGRFQVKSARFHTWNPPDFERPFARNGKPYVICFVFLQIEIDLKVHLMVSRKFRQSYVAKALR